MATNSFSNKKELRFVITLATGNFGTNTATNQITLEGYRASINVDRGGALQMGTLHAKIWGLSQADMSSATTMQWTPQTFMKNQIQVFAIDGPQVSLVFSGVIVNAWGIYDAMPNVYLMIQAQVGYWSQIQPVTPVSIKAGTPIAPLFDQYAAAMGLAFQNEGVTGSTTSNLYLPGTNIEQLNSLALQTGVSRFISGDNGTLYISPPNTPLQGEIVLVSSDTGLKGYPIFDGVGVNFRMLYNPAIQINRKIQLQTNVIRANGVWIVLNMAFDLDSELPNGNWYATVRGNKNGFAVYQ